MLVVNEDVKQPSKMFVLYRALGLPSGLRCNHVNSPPKWIDGTLQVDIDRTLETHVHAAVRAVDSLHTIANASEPQGHALSTAHPPEPVLNMYIKMVRFIDIHTSASRDRTSAS